MPANSSAPPSTSSSSDSRAASGYDYDLIVIGSGPAGQKAAVQGAKAGKKVAIVEEYPQLGGGCVHFGTLPSKSFRESVYRYSLSSRGALGQARSSKSAAAKAPREMPDMQRLLQRKDRVIENESQIIADQLKRNKVAVFHGRARFASAHEVDVQSAEGLKRISGNFIFIATGARPVTPQKIDVKGEHVYDSNSILTLKKIPRTLVVLGAGIIGCEYASMFSMAGTKVYLVDRRHEVLSTIDREIVSHLVERFTAEGMDVSLGCEAEKLECLQDDCKAGGVRVRLTNGREIEAEAVLICLGRIGNTEGLGLENVGIQPDERGLIAVDGQFRTKVPNIYAIGDVVGAPALASTSMEQGRVACCHAFQIEEWNFHHGFTLPPLYPYGIYTIPEISTLGKTEEELIAEKADYIVGRARYKELARGQIIGDQWGLLKLLVDRTTLKLLGVHIVGDAASNLIHVGQAVMTLGGDVRYFIRSVFNYPTLTEAYKTAALHAASQLKKKE